jgi:arginine kinase
MGGCNTKDSAVSEPKKAGTATGDAQAASKQTAFNSAEELMEFDTFFQKGTSSELSKCLTKEIWEEYKDMSCKAGVSFKTCIFSGIKNQDSGIGIYAGSQDSYTTFNKLFDQVILNYHQHKLEDTHKSGMTSEELTDYELSEEDAAMIVSTRIRVGRNLAAYPLGPGVTKEQRLEIMKMVCEAAESFDDDLKGKFYPLDGMSKED